VGGPLLPHPRPGRHQGRHHPPPQDRAAAQGHHRHRPGRQPTIAWTRDHTAITAAAATDGSTPWQPTWKAPTCVPCTCYDATNSSRSSNGATATPKRPSRSVRSFSTTTTASTHSSPSSARTVIFGLIEADLRRAIAPATHLPGLLPEQRAARPTGTNILAAFDHLAATYTPTGLILDRLTPTQRTILAHLDIPLPWPERQDPDPKRCGKRD
jgi:hypothetical protein